MFEGVFCKLFNIRRAETHVSRGAIVTLIFRKPTNFGKRTLRAFIKHPSLILNAPRGAEAVYRKHMQTELDRTSSLWRTDNNGPIESFEKVRHNKYSILYSLCRRFRPRIVVETGVYEGRSTAFLLQALRDNGHGRLYSIDLPNASYALDEKYKLGEKRIHSDLLPNGKHSGYRVPLSLRSNWDLILGDSKVELPRLVSELGSLDLFHHDSMHTYEHMYFEYQTIWPKLTTGGVLISDDVNWNDAFADFCKVNNVRTHIVRGDSQCATGFVIKGENIV